MRVPPRVFRFGYDVATATLGCLVAQAAAAALREALWRRELAKLTEAHQRHWERMRALLGLGEDPPGATS